jgi:hypothetical protein
MRVQFPHNHPVIVHEVPRGAHGGMRVPLRANAEWERWTGRQEPTRRAAGMMGPTHGLDAPRQ